MIDLKEARVTGSTIKALAKTSLDFLLTVREEDLFQNPDLPRENASFCRRNPKDLLPPRNEQGHYLSIDMKDGLIHAYAFQAAKNERAPAAIEMIFIPDRESPKYIQMILRSDKPIEGYNPGLKDFYGNVLSGRKFNSLPEAIKELKRISGT